MNGLTRRTFIGGAAVASVGLGLVACSGGNSQGGASNASGGTDEIKRICEDQSLIDAAKKEGKLVVYGSAEEAQIAAVCKKFQELFGIETTFARLSTGEVASKIEEERGKPSADVWFGGTTDPYNVSLTKGLLEPYKAANAKHLISPMFMDKNGGWYGIYKGILGFFYNTDEFSREKLDPPKDWEDLLDPKYKGKIWMSNYNTAGTAKLVLNTIIQKYGKEKGIKFLVDLDKNVAVYTKSGSGPSKNVGTGECALGIGFLHDAIYQIEDLGYGNIGVIIPAAGTTFEVGATAIFKGCQHSNAAKLWIEYCLSPTAVELAQTVGAYQFLVLDDAKQPKVVEQFNLDPNNVVEYDFEDAKLHTEEYVKELMQALGGGDTRFQTS